MKPILTRKLISKTKFMRWLRSQEHTRTFDFADTTGCLFASFLNETNPGEEFSCGSATFSHRSAVWASHRFPQWAEDISHVLGAGHRNFSARFVRALLEFKNT